MAYLVAFIMKFKTYLGKKGYLPIKPKKLDLFLKELSVPKPN